MGNTGKKIVIDPITRVEGHGRVTLHLDENGKLGQARFHIVEFRGFERFIQGHPYWEVPALVQRLCGICPVSHHLAAAKAVDRLEGLDPEQLTPAADLQRRLLHYGQIFQSHALHFFYLAAPDLLFGTDAPAEQRNVVSLANHDKELARQGILMRKFGQEIIRTIAGKRIHGVAAVPGGVYKVFTPQDRDFFLNGKVLSPSAALLLNRYIFPAGHPCCARLEGVPPKNATGKGSSPANFPAISQNGPPLWQQASS